MGRSQIRPLLDLPPDWDSYGGLPIDKQSADFATALLIYLGNRYVEPPSVVPTSKGGVSLEWYRPTLEVGFEVRPGPRGHPQLSIFYSNDATGVEWEDEYAKEPHRTRGSTASLTSSGASGTRSARWRKSTRRWMTRR